MAQAKAAPAQTRGERNNNPGNIDYSPNNPWRGKLPRDVSIEPRFERFDSALNGGRAAVKLVEFYKDRRGINTIRGVISTWAPPSENNTRAYVDAVARAVGVDPDEIVDLTEYRIMRPLLEAIIRHENGRVIYSPEEIDEMLRRAGIVNPAAPAIPPKPAKAPAASTASAAGVSGGGVLATAIAVVTEPNLREAVAALDYKWLLAALAVAGVLLSAYAAYRAARANRAAP